MADFQTQNTDAQETWFDNRWRPAMAWQYFIVCLFDFLIAPILMGFYSAYTGEFHSWDPLTIRGGGLYHIAMGGVVGVAVWSRGKEKMAILNTVGATGVDDAAVTTSTTTTTSVTGNTATQDCQPNNSRVG